ncbi:nucleotide-binding alpha-beta plait domain-containing protein [Tanacetum coccineum]
MGFDEWQEVSRKGFKKDIRMGRHHRSKEDDVSKISTSIFVTNFPEYFSSKELFHLCKQYGHVVDSFIPTKRTKGGKRFGFVRFINVFSVDRLVNNLCTIWVDRFKLHANVARFNREPSKTHNTGVKVGNKSDVDPDMAKKATGYSANHSSYAHVLKAEHSVANIVESEPPTIVLDDDCLFSKKVDHSLMGRVKDFASLPNLKTAFAHGGFNDITIRYMGELWVMLEFSSDKTKVKFRDNVDMGSWFSTLQQASYDFKVDDRIAWIEVEGVPFKFWTENTFKRIAHKWGELLEVDDVEELCYHSRRLCIRTSSRSTIRDYFKIVFRGNVYWIRANEVPGWVPDFTEESDEDDQSVEESKGEEHNTHDAEDIDSGTDVEEVAETDFEVTNAQNVPTSEDIFGIYPLLDNLKKKKTCNDTVQEDTLSHPPGFTPKENNNEIKADETQNYKKHNKDDWPNGDDNSSINMDTHHVASNSGCSGRFKRSEKPRGGASILCVLDEVVKVGQTMGFNMEGCMNDITKIIESQGASIGVR